MNSPWTNHPKWQLPAFGHLVLSVPSPVSFLPDYFEVNPRYPISNVNKYFSVCLQMIKMLKRSCLSIKIFPLNVFC